MKNKKRRIKIFFTMDSDLFTEFEKNCKDKCIDKSLLLDMLIKEWLNNKIIF